MAGNEHKANDRRGPYRITGEELERVRAMQERFREELHGTSRACRLALLRSLTTDVTETTGERLVNYLAPNIPREGSKE
jgi:hypothetical protein